MVNIGYFLSCEEFGPRELVRQAKLAEQAGFERLWISDHFHPWNAEQGNSPFVWSVIGALSEAVSLPITTAVTCPTVRFHPAIIAQAAATAAVQLEGRFTLGVGSGEALNEHILGDPWPSVGVRLAMLEEAVELIRLLHRGEQVSFHGEHYQVQDAQIWTLPDQPVPIYISGFGPQATELAARIGDGYCTASPDPELVGLFRKNGDPSRPVQGGVKVCRGQALAERAPPRPTRADPAATPGLRRRVLVGVARGGRRADRLRAGPAAASASHPTLPGRELRRDLRAADRAGSRGVLPRLVGEGAPRTGRPMTAL